LERRSQELHLNGWCFVLEGVVETFSERVGGGKNPAFNMEKELVFPMENPKKTHGKSKKTQGFS